MIASLSLTARQADETAFVLNVEIGQPYLVSADPVEWRCPVSLHPLHDRLTEVAAMDSLQALCLATSLLRSLLADFLDKGGQLTHESGAAFSLADYALAAPSPTS